jgi:hypothetical protein
VRHRRHSYRWANRKDQRVDVRSADIVSARVCWTIHRHAANICRFHRTGGLAALDRSHMSTMPERSEHQKRIIKSYYRNLDGIMLAKLQDLVGQLYLAESDRKRDRLWGRVRKALVNLKIGPDLVEHIVSTRDPKVLAANVEDWLKTSR